MNKDFLSWLGHAGSHTCMIQNAGTTYYFVRVQKNEDFDYLYCQRQYSGKGLAVAARSNMPVSFAGGMASCMTRNTMCRAWPVRIHRSAAQASCGKICGRLSGGW